MEYIQVSAKTVEDAVVEAAIKLMTTRESISYEVIEKGSSGFLGFGAKPAVIKAWVKSEEEVKNQEKAREEVSKIVEQLNQAAPAEQKEEKKEIKTDVDRVQEAKEFLNRVFAAMEMQVEVQVSENLEEHTMDVELSGSEMGVLIGKRGQTLDSLQYLVSLVVNKYSEDYIRVKVDTEDYRKRRKETLENLAKNISYKVKRTRKPVALEPMNPYERRIIHSALQGDRYVATHSEGEEPFRRVVVTLKENAGYEKRRYNNNRNRNYHKNKER